MREFWSKIGSKIDPKIDAKIDAKIESVQKAQVPENPGPGVPVRGKEFLPETPGSRFAIGKTSSYKQPSCKQLKSKALKITAPPTNTHWCAGRHGADLLI